MSLRKPRARKIPLTTRTTCPLGRPPPHESASVPLLWAVLSMTQSLKRRRVPPPIRKATLRASELRLHPTATTRPSSPPVYIRAHHRLLKTRLRAQWPWRRLSLRPGPPDHLKTRVARLWEIDTTFPHGRPLPLLSPNGVNSAILTFSLG